MFSPFYKRIRHSNGVSLTGYGLIVGLISVVALVTIDTVGSSITSLFSAVDGELETVTASSGGGAGPAPSVEPTPFSGQPACTSPLNPTRGADPAAGGPGCDAGEGMIYAGQAPDGATLYVAFCDIGMTMGDGACDGSRQQLPWADSPQDGGASTSIPALDIGNSGDLPTANGAASGLQNNAMLSEDADSVEPGVQPFQAAQACADLQAHGRTDWYLPAIGELDVIYANLAATDDPDHLLSRVGHLAGRDNSGSTGPIRSTFETNSGAGLAALYWSSSLLDNFSTNFGLFQRFHNGDQWNTTGSNQLSVRCARR
ncbi:MAG: hypothetical protein Alpg2KO_03300 [Alphaproteobacteria bacterium]